MKYVTFYWTESNIYPQMLSEPIVCLSDNGKIMTFTKTGTEKEWMWKAEKYNIKYWAYQSQLK